MVFLVFVWKQGFQEVPKVIPADPNCPAVVVDMSQARPMTDAEIYHWSHYAGMK